MTAQLAAGTELESSQPRSAWRRVGRVVAYVAVALLLWEAYVMIAQVPIYMLPSPRIVLAELGRMAVDGMLWSNLAYTLRNIVFGFVSGVLIGIALGYLLHSSRWVQRILTPYIVVLQAAPKIAIAPLLVLWFGLGLSSQLTLIVLLAFFPMMMSMLLGMNSISDDVHALARLLNLDTWQRFAMIQLPGAMPSLAAGAKLAIVDSMTGAFLAEYISAQQGLGFIMLYGNTTYTTPMLMAAVVVTVIVGLSGYALIGLLERRLLRWRG